MNSNPVLIRFCRYLLQVSLRDFVRSEILKTYPKNFLIPLGAQNISKALDVTFARLRHGCE